MKYVGLGYITSLSYAELLFPRIRAPLLLSRSLEVRTALQLEGVSLPDHKPTTQFGLLAIKEKILYGRKKTCTLNGKYYQVNVKIGLRKQIFFIA